MVYHKKVLCAILVLTVDGKNSSIIRLVVVRAGFCPEYRSRYYRAALISGQLYV